MTRIIDRALGALGLTRKSKVKAGFDLTKTNHENKRHWADSDALSGRASYFKQERKIARERSRMEAANNSWYAGMLRTAANHIVGTGPRLQFFLSDEAASNRLERAFGKWMQATAMVEKLRIAVETYWRDGEWFAMRSGRPSLWPVQLDVRAYEADQVAMPYWHVLDPTIEDGKRVDNLGNAVEYWIYDHHPGDLNVGHMNLLGGQWYHAEDVIHLYRADRPGQLRGFPRCAPAIDWLAHMRRFSKATLSAAEAAALWGVFIKTTSSQVTPAQMPADLMTIEFERNVMNFLPDGWEPQQLNATHPTTTNETFQRTELTYFARCCNMPYSLAAGTSRDSNFSSAQMDIRNTWEPEVRSEQEKLTRDVMAPIIRWFLEDAAISTDLLDGAPQICEIDYQVVWPPLPQLDENELATAAQTRIQNGLSTLPMEYAKSGIDAQTAIRKGAEFFGITVDEYQKALFAKIFATGGAPGGDAPAPDPAAATDAGTASAGAFVGTKRRDFTNNQKATADVLQSFIDGTSEVIARQSLIRLGWSDEAADALLDDARDGSIDSDNLDPSSQGAGL